MDVAPRGHKVLLHHGCSFGRVMRAAVMSVRLTTNPAGSDEVRHTCRSATHL